MDILIPLVTWMALIAGLGFCLYPMMQPIIKDETTAYALSKILGIFTFGYCAWVLGLLQMLSLDLPSLAGLLLVIAVLSYLLVTLLHGDWDSMPFPAPQSIMLVEGLFFGSFLLFYTVQAFHPEIYWGEKPMDFTFLNFFTRNTTLPPQDPWAAGNTMSYYYVGALLFGIFHKITGMTPAVGYGVSVATVGALIVIAAFSACYALTQSRLAGLVGGLSIACMGTYDMLYLWFIKGMKLSFDLYWATSRTFHTPGINEYPLWTTLFADLHAHFIAIPLAGALIALLVVYVRSFSSTDSIASPLSVAALTGFVWGFLAAVNTWDYITYGVCIGLATLLSILLPGEEKLLRHRALAALAGITALVCSILFSLPFHLSVTSNTKIQWGYVYPEEFNSFGEIFRIHGHWLILVLAASILHFAAQRSKKHWSRLLGILIFAPVPILLGFVHIYIHQIPEAPWGVLIAATICTACGSILLCTEEDSRISLASLLIYCGGILLSAMELHFLMDRMNTTFKVNNAIWMLLGAGSLTLAWTTFSKLRAALIQRISLGGFILALLPAICGGITAIHIMCTFNRLHTPRPSLDGTSYLHSFNPSEKTAFDWINKNIHGVPVMVEAVGPSYQEFTRFSMNTGLPVVLGWSYHVQQRGTQDSHERKRDVETLYTSPLAKEALKLLNKYNVSLIIVGRQERLLYPQEGLLKFEKDPSNFPLLFQTGSGDQLVQIFTTSYSQIRR